MEDTFEKSLVFSAKNQQSNSNKNLPIEKAKKTNSIWYTHKGNEVSQKVEKRLILVLIVTSIIGISQLFFAYFSNSLAVLGDSVNQIVDAIAIGVCYISFRYSSRKPNQKFTYGYQRFEIIGAIICNTLLIFTLMFLIIESVARINGITQKGHKHNVVGLMVIFGAFLSIILGVFLVFTLKSKKEIFQFYQESEK